VCNPIRNLFGRHIISTTEADNKLNNRIPASSHLHTTMRSFGARSLPLLLLSALPAGVLGGDILSTDGFSTCIDNPSIKVTNLDVTYDKNTRKLNFNLAAVSNVEQKVKAELIVSAYGQQVYTDSFNPCDTGMPQMCPGELRFPSRCRDRSLT
jgi:hypothetical protein